MKILYAGVRFEHYDPARRHSFEYNNFFRAFATMPGVTVAEHPFDRILEVGVKAYNNELYALAERERPDALFAFMYTDELDPVTLRALRDDLHIPTIAWFADDYWRYFNYSRHWADAFSFLVTTSPQAAGWYRRDGIRNVISSQWACNTDLYTPRDIAKDIDVSFVGQFKPGRARLIRFLERQGIAAEAFGFGWPNGKLSEEEMLKVFSRSRINLNLNVRPSRFEPRVLARLFLRKSVTRLVPDLHLRDNLRAWWHFALPHTHARPFELAGCRAFVLSGYSEGIERYYEPDKEMVFYRTEEELAEKARYYLSHEKERDAIARAGYERTMREHTYEKRLGDILAKTLHS